MKVFMKRFAWGLLSMSLTVGTSTAVADDTEIFFTDADKIVKPNILFILDKSGSMSNIAEGTSNRLEVVQAVMGNLLDDMEDVNVGAMYFGGNDGGYFLSAIKPIADVRSPLKTAINGLSPGGNTPLSETTFEAMRYFQGGDTFIRHSSVADVMDGNKYDSPIEYQCQPNNIILLTDGQPTQDTNYQSTMESTVGSCSGNCLDEIAEYMFDNDMSTEQDGPQSIRTYTVGFQSNQTLLSDAASNGGGQYFQANDAASLATAFETAFNDILATSATYVAPGIAVNTFDRLNHLDALYFALFQPAKGARWPGNLKRYKLAIQENSTTGQSEAVIVGEDGQPAVDPNSGFFKDSAQSWWGNIQDGKVVTDGGASSQHADPNSDRKVYSNLATNRGLTNSANALATGNNNLTKALFGDTNMSDADFSALVNWTRGQDLDDSDGDASTTDSRKFIADPLHSVPHLIVYGGSESSPDTAVFFGDNQGFIHGIDGETGETHFSFMPKDLLKNQAGLKENSETANKVYGMDSSILSWVHDDNNDGSISAGDGDFAYIYSGMRRGGSNYYALDVTNPDQPDFLWSIQGGQANTDFAELGQTWSRPSKTKVEIGNQIHDVLIFGGGYDADQDDATTRTVDDIGRALYIVDAETGDRLWWAGPTGSGANLELADLKYSIPSAPKALDLTGDGKINQIYVGDMGGQIFRFDVTNSNAADDLVTGGVIADLAEDNSTANNRRFYHAPDLFGLKFGGTRFLGLVIGSGFQAHPLDENIDDRIYMMRIPEISAPPVDDQGNVLYTPITEADLYDATDNLVQQGTSQEQNDAAAAIGLKDGWYIRLTNSGEKVLSTSQTINNEVFVTTYEPTPSTNICIPSAGTSRLYHLSVLDGRAVVNYDGVGAADELTRPDREVELNTIGLPADPQRMRVDDTDVVCVGAECVTVDSLKGVVETYWYEE
ncbi:pilus assembly protein PilY [Marinobacter salinus]|uniref:Pilus assembly protein PilY n=1 Tax=Marinobacter salinus TaxID=1874317 RepID=A0A1D9GMB8_9GAMM|nr:PilC/PilY family type IV pilus protein [Marinobacter salinus]AOY88788.1 pilus assembly protein PilY [Marinobacter salinus]